MAKSIIIDGVLREEWDDIARVYSRWDAAGELLASRVFNEEEHAAADEHAERTNAQANRLALVASAQTALVNNRDFLAIPAPTNVQVLAQTKALSRQSNGVIRMLLGQLDATD